MSTPWNGIPDDPDKSGWHWITADDWMWPCYWNAEVSGWGPPLINFPMKTISKCEYLGPCTPPITRCRDGSSRVAVSAEFRRESDEIYIRMNDETGHYIDGYYWHKGGPVIDIVGKTIPEIDMAAREYRQPKQEDPA